MNNSQFKNMTWIPSTWEKFPHKHIPKYSKNLREVKRELLRRDPLVDFKDIITLKNQLSAVESNKLFIVQMGECAERFSQSTEDDVQSRVTTLNNFCLLFKGLKKIIKIGRMAGQYTKPRSHDFELSGGQLVQSYKGDIVHDFYDRKIDSKRLLLAYDNSKLTLDILRNMNENIFVSHEALNLHYEECMSTVQEDNKYYNLSAHSLWLGERTRFKTSAHVEYLRGVHNPIGIKISSEIVLEDLLSIIKILNPSDEIGKIMLICRFGHLKVGKYLGEIITAVENNKLNVLWLCDPMHGNTFVNANGIKSRRIEDIKKELINFTQIMNGHNKYIAGVHLENSWEDIYECEEENNLVDNLKYKTLCDPRLNSSQSIEIGKLLTTLLPK